MDRAARERLRIGAYEVSYDLAHHWVTDYVATKNTRSGYWAYDNYCGSSSTTALDESDLLAPVLLNAPVTVQAFRWLRAQIPALNQALSDIPADADLADAYPGPGVLAPLFKVFDEGQRPGRRPKSGVGPTILSKVLHRKRPAFIPLWDEQVRTCYVKAPGAPVPKNRHRPYAEWITFVGEAVRADLNDNPVAWKTLADLAPSSGSRLTPLRALDIVAWRLGGNPHPRSSGRRHHR